MAGRKDFFKTIDDITGKETLAQACTEATSGVSQIVATDPTTGLIDPSLLPASSASGNFSIFPIWAEESGALASNSTQWSYGNGATGTIGIVLPVDAEAFAMTLEADVVGTSVSIELMQNDLPVVSTLFVGSRDFVNLDTPIQFVAGQQVGFRTDVEIGAYSDVRVAVWFRIRTADVAIDPLLSNGGNANSLHHHSELCTPDTTDLAVITENDLNLRFPGYPETRDDGGVFTKALTSTDANGSVVLSTILPFYQSQKVDTPLANQSTALLAHNSLTLVIPDDGLYEVRVFFLWSSDSAATDFISELRHNGATLARQRHEPQDVAGVGIVADTINAAGTINTGTDQRYPSYMEDDVQLLAGSHTFELVFAASTTNDEPTVYQSLVKVRRVQ